jgi:OTU domain-containing protein 3
MSNKKHDRAKSQDHKRAFNAKSKFKTKERNKGGFPPANDAVEDRDLLDRVGELGLCIAYVEGDGNCLFRALALQLWGDESLWHRSREEIVDYIKEHREHFECFIEDDESFEGYVERMSTSAEWGGNQEIFAAVQLYNVDVTIFQAGRAFITFLL